MGKGDTLASGGVRASFGPIDVTKEKWDEVFSDGTFTVKEDKKKRGGKGNGNKRHSPKKARV